MHHYPIIVLLSATPHMGQTPQAAPGPEAGSSVLMLDEEDEKLWVDYLIELLDRLCEIIGPEFCASAEDMTADTHMLRYINYYSANGIDDVLSESEKAKARTHIKDIYQHIQAPQQTSASVVASMELALEESYEDLGGDPADL